MTEQITLLRTSAEVESNNSFSSANKITSGSEVTGGISSTSDIDFYQLDVANAGTIQIEFDNPINYSIGSYFEISLIDANGNSLGFFEADGDQTYKVGVSSAGTYFIKIEDGGSQTTDQYVFTTTFDETSKPFYELGTIKPSSGYLEINPNGNYLYIPNQDFHGQDTFTYLVTDLQGYVTEYLVKISIESKNDASTTYYIDPFGLDDLFASEAVVDGGISGNEIWLVDSNGFKVVFGFNEALSETSSDVGTLEYFRIYNGSALIASAEGFSVFIGSIDNLDNRIDQIYSYQNNVTLTSGNDIYDVDDQADTSEFYSVDGGSGNDTIYSDYWKTSDVNIFKAPGGSYRGEFVASGVQFELKNFEKIDLADTDLLTIDEAYLNFYYEKPTAAAYTYTAREDFTLEGQLPTGETTNWGINNLSYQLASGPSYGSINLGENGEFTYLPNKGYFGLDSFSYVVNDGFSDSNEAIITLDVIENYDPSGYLGVLGQSIIGERLTVIDSLVDKDGVGVISYQWLLDGEPIPGETSPDLLVDQTMLGSQLQVKATYIDDQGSNEEVLSDLSDKVVARESGDGVNLLLDIKSDFLYEDGSYSDGEEVDANVFAATVTDIIKLISYIDRTYAQSVRFEESIGSIKSFFDDGSTITREFDPSIDVSGNEGTVNADRYIFESDALGLQLIIDGDITYSYNRSEGTLYVEPSTSQSMRIKTISEENVGTVVSAINITGSINTDGADVTGTINTFSVLTEVDQTSEISRQLWSGSLTVSADANAVVWSNENAAVTGSIYSAFIESELGSKVYVSGDASAIPVSIQQDTSIDALFENAAFYPGDDVISISMPDELTQDWVVRSGDGDDLITLTGGNGHLHVEAGSGDDVISLISQSHEVIAGDGYDKAVYLGDMNDYQITWSTLSQSFVVNSSLGSTDTLHDLEKIEFSDGELLLTDDGFTFNPEPEKSSTKYYISESNGMFLQLSTAISELELPGQSFYVEGNRGPETLYVGNGIAIDASVLGSGANKIMLEGAFDDYSILYTDDGKYTFFGKGDAGHGRTESVIVSASTVNGSAIYFSDGYLSLYDEDLVNTSGDFIKPIGLTGTTSSTATFSFEDVSAQGSSPTKVYIFENTGGVITPFMPGSGVVIQGNQGIDKVYVGEGTVVDASTLGSGADQVYLQGDFADYKNECTDDGVYTFTGIRNGHDEILKVSASTVQGKKLFFADGSASLYDEDLVDAGGSFVVIAQNDLDAESTPFAII